MKKHSLLKPLKTIGKVLLVGFLLIVFFPFIFAYVAYDVYLRLKFRGAYRRQGKFILFVYSNSPVWGQYIEGSLLPYIQPHAIVLNWSKRNQWDARSWPVQAFRQWGGTKNFNPMAIFLTRGLRIEVIRFYEAFKDYKHGKEETLQKAERRLFELIKMRNQA